MRVVFGPNGKVFTQQQFDEAYKSVAIFDIDPGTGKRKKQYRWSLVGMKTPRDCVARLPPSVSAEKINSASP
jgi:hypothetical protein